VGVPVDPTLPGPPPAEARAVERAGARTVLVFESARGNGRRVDDLLRSLGYRVHLPGSSDEAAALLVGDVQIEVVVLGMPGGEGLVRAVQDGRRRRPLALIVAASSDTAHALGLVEKHGADSFVLRPYKRDAMAAVLRAATVVVDERRARFGLERELGDERTRRARSGEADPHSGFYHFDFFKRVLVLELKRARRHGYALATALVALDRTSPGGAPSGAPSEAPGRNVDPAVRADQLAHVAQAVRAVVRDIDLPVDYGAGRLLVFLPYTDLAGAERVGKRIEAAVRQAPIGATVSVGIAALRAGASVSFAKLVRDATLALRAAELKGGGRVVVKP
jgi:PleD family two-component response regulator